MKTSKTKNEYFNLSSGENNIAFKRAETSVIK